MTKAGDAIIEGLKEAVEYMKEDRISMSEEVLTTEERQRLNKLFAELWGNKTGVSGSWGSDSHGYHPTYIHRGNILLCGETSFKSIHVVVPPDAEVQPVRGDSRAHCNTIPTVVNGKLVQVFLSDSGPWWAKVREELSKMEEEAVASLQSLFVAKTKKIKEEKRMREEKLNEARASFSGIES